MGLNTIDLSRMDLSTGALDRLRTVGDPVVDELIRTLSDREEDAVSRLFRQLVATDDPLPRGLPAAAADYFSSTSEWPSWGDRDQVRAGERVFEKYGPELITGLFCAALPQCYANHRGVRVLTMTGRMQKTGLERRIMETAQFVCDIVDRGGLGESGRGIRAIQKVRLMHGGIRELVLGGSGVNHYDVTVHGVPVCQEDLAFTLMSFSVVLLDSVEALGVVVSASDREAWVHLWRVVGHFIGLEDGANPSSYAEAQAFATAYRKRNFGPSQDGRELTTALVGFMTRLIPGRVFDGIPAALIRCLNGDPLADMLGVKQASATRFVIKAEIEVIRALDRIVPGGVGILPGIGMWFDELLRLIAVASRGGKQASFRIPQHLSRTRSMGAARRITRRTT